MNPSSCSVCGDYIDISHSFTVDQSHFYHKECFEHPQAWKVIENCEICIRSYFTTYKNSDVCGCCGSQLEPCKLMLGLCETCSQYFYNSKYRKFCSLCKTVHDHKYTFCLACQRTLRENENNPQMLHYYCENCIQMLPCECCRRVLQIGDYVCEANHFIHKECLIKRPKPVRNCGFCSKIYNDLYQMLLATQSSVTCLACRSFSGEIIYTCMNYIFYCENCKKKVGFVDLEQICNCEYCESLAEFRENQKRMLITCSHCKIRNFQKFISKCGSVKICESCETIKSKPAFLFQMLEKCGCKQCKEQKFDYLKACSLCLDLDFNTKDSSCNSNNFYCENCLKNKDKINKILKTCDCTYCLKEFSEKMENADRKCKYCNTLINMPQNCKKLEFCCKNCVNFSINSIECTCGHHNQQNYLNTLMGSITNPNCQKCGKKSDFAIKCNHNQCFGCVLKTNIGKFFEFFENYKRNQYNAIPKEFMFGCSYQGCKEKFRFSMNFCWAHIQVFSDNDQQILFEFWPYFEGIEFEFRFCNCRQIVAFNNEVKLGCICRN